MPVPAETEPGRADLPLIDRAAARELRTAESSGLGRTGTDEIFDQWLGSFGAIAFYRNADRPLQARPVETSDKVPEWLNNSRIGSARLEAVCITGWRPASPQGEKPAEVSPADEVDEQNADEVGEHSDDGEEEEEWDEDYEDDDEDDDPDTCTCDGMPGLCWNSCEADEAPYAKVDHRHRCGDGDEDPCALDIVNAYAGGMGEDPSYGLSGELPPDYREDSIQGLIRLIEAAQRKLDAERWDTIGPWHLLWSSCESDVTNPDCEGEETDSCDDELGWESDAIRYFAEIDNEDDVPTLRITGARWGELHIVYNEPVSGPGGEPLGAGTVKGLRTFLERATEQVGEAGYEMNGEWTVGWSRCYVLLGD